LPRLGDPQPLVEPARSFWRRVAETTDRIADVVCDSAALDIVIGSAGISHRLSAVRSRRIRAGLI
jgi:hypothetical protein